MFKESTEKLVGNDAFEGYAIDLISEIARILRKCPFWRQLSVSVWLSFSNLGFNYTFKWVDDGAYGYKNKETGEWNGLMGELLSQVRGTLQRWGILTGSTVHPPNIWTLNIKNINITYCNSELCTAIPWELSITPKLSQQILIFPGQGSLDWVWS